MESLLECHANEARFDEENCYCGLNLWTMPRWSWRPTPRSVVMHWTWYCLGRSSTMEFPKWSGFCGLQRPRLMDGIGGKATGYFCSHGMDSLESKGTRFVCKPLLLLFTKSLLYQKPAWMSSTWRGRGQRHRCTKWANISQSLAASSSGRG